MVFFAHSSTTARRGGRRSSASSKLTQRYSWCSGRPSSGETGSSIFSAVGLGDVVARDLVAGVGSGFFELVAEGIVQVGEPGFFRDFAPGGVELAFAGLDHALGEVPVLVGAQDEEADAAFAAAKDDRACGASDRVCNAGSGFHPAIL